MTALSEIVQSFVEGLRADLAQLTADDIAKLPDHEQRFWEDMRGLLEAWDRSEAGDATALDLYMTESLKRTLATLTGLPGGPKAPRRVVLVDGVEVDAARFLFELYTGTAPRGMGELVAAAVPRLTLEGAERMLAREWPFEFDYVCGRPIKVHEVRGQPGVIDTAFSRRLYDRDAGAGAFDAALRRAMETPPE